MATRKRQSAGGLDRLAEVVGHSLGRMTRTVDSLKARHPDPAAEVAAVVNAGRKRVSERAAQAKATTAKVAKQTKAAAQRTRQAVGRTRRKGAKAIDSAGRTTVKQVTRAKRTVKRVRKTIARRVKPYRR